MNTLRIDAFLTDNVKDQWLLKYRRLMHFIGFILTKVLPLPTGQTVGKVGMAFPTLFRTSQITFIDTALISYLHLNS